MPDIGFIGGGNMAGSLIGGLINAGYAAADITVSEPNEERLQTLKNDFNVKVSIDNNTTLNCDIIILSVKPQILKTVCNQLVYQQQAQNKTGHSKLNKPLFISIAAGVKSTDINRWLNNDQAIVRCMPNTPALLQCGATGLFANKFVTDSQKQQAEKIMQAVGITIWVDNETQLNAVTAVSGSGPAYFFLMMEAMVRAGEKLGLTADVAQKLVLQTALGAARMASESDVSPAELRQRVTSKGGTTEQAILSFQSANYQQIVFDALNAANNRSISLADELASDKII
jgi:pyrroline-5-carboxylate reductase